MKLRFLKLMLLLFILPLQMLAAELGVAGKQLAALPGVSNVETLKSTHFPEKYVFFIKQQLDAKDASKGYFEQRVVLCHRGFDRPTHFLERYLFGSFCLLNLFTHSGNLSI